MFKILNSINVKTMIDLSKEIINDSQLVYIKEQLHSLEIETLFQLCKEHELDGVVAANILKFNIIELPDYWQRAYNKEKKQLTLLKHKAIEISNIMANNNIKMVILKNGGIMIDMITDVVKCPMEDIDTLVKKSDFKAAHRILINNGFNFKFRSEYDFEKLEEAFRDGSTEYYIYSETGDKIWFELSWRTISGKWIRPDKEPNTDLLLDHSYLAKGTQVGILSPEDNLLQVCLHTAKHSYVRAPGLRLHLDVERIVAHKNINWEIFLKKVQMGHFKVSTYYSLYIPSILFGTEIPDYILNELRPPNRKQKKIEKIIRHIELLHPKQKKFNKFQFLIFQLLLYDNLLDALKVLYPGYAWMKERYKINSVLKLPYYIFIRCINLIGYRKKKS